MSNEDPFGLENDAARTRVRPVRRNSASAQQQPAAAPVRGAPVRSTRSSDNPLVNAFSTLLGLAPELESAAVPENPEVLRTRLLETLTQARDSAVAVGVPLSRADQGAWFVAALLDDIALNTPWGGNSGWPRMPLVVSMYGNVDAGERFFDLAEDLVRFPERDPQLMELVFLCLSLGFRGKFRRDGAQGEAAIARTRGQMSRLLRDRDAADAPLAPHWKGVEADDEEKRFIVPLWSIILMALALTTAIYVGLGIKLSNRGEQLFTLAGVLPPPTRADIYRPIIETEAQPQLSADPLMFELLPLFGAAAPEATAKALTGREDVSIAVIVVQATAPEVFRSAKADLNPDYTTLIESIAAVIVQNSEFIGSVRVTGHTDSIQVRKSNPFRSNQGLSEGRAKTIADMLIAAGVPAELVTSNGKAATDPIGDNATRAGRARNRRVEIILQKKV
ncbi:type IVB secretion system protein IcmH/DotU [Lentibacter algarum]|uniref:type IVB secretion system protein IcmH/DotU n=1 Tax=Lentibacter algarum TaxID=576131 RepID=UPI001C07D8DC|nr:type IVB secretion system protein IcmH/DotU [Lentibacter algarum]MBU2980571.1 type IVB secretion system protein IcmH/DotU [Lentibacter algarum]